MKQKALIFFLLSLCAFAGNLLNIPLLFGSVHIVLGGIFAFIALELLGFVPAFAVALIASVQLFLLWGHPWGAVVALLEFLFVALLYRKRNFELITADWLFWLLVGIPVYMAGLKYLLGVQEYVLHLPFKGAVNGLLNTSLASLALLLFYMFIKREKRLSFRRLVLVSTLVLSTIPLFAKTLYDTFHEEEIIVKDVKEDIHRISYYAKIQLAYWLRVHLNAVETLANALEALGKDNVQELQRQTEAVHKTFRDFHACYIADENATALTFYPKVNPKGRYMIGVNFNYRPYYREAKKTLKPVFTKVFIAKFALRPVVGIAVPAVKDGKFIGYAYCGLNLEHAKELLGNLSAESGIYLTLVDREGTIIVSSSPEQKTFTQVELSKFKVLKGGLAVHIREGSNRIPLKRWEHAHFFYSDLIREGVSWMLVAESEVSPYRIELLSILG